MQAEKIKELIAQMTLEEKASICSGSDFWHTQAIERLGVDAVMVSDGPHGLRKQDEAADHLGINDSIKAVCFPAGCGTAASFNTELLTHMGEVLGEECQAEGVSVILGPAVNIKRSPLCGRNFEYYSEDPFVASKIAGALIKGVQSKHVGTSIKHFLANNQEERRMSVTAQVDERTLREIYLAAFEDAICTQKPWTVMCSYNKINGVYAAQNKRFLTDILRSEWGFDGYVMSDWGAVNSRVADLEAGLDLEMPASGGINDRLIVEAVQNQSLDETILDQAVERILTIGYRFQENRDPNAVFDRDRDHQEARLVAEETIVLLKNEGILPLARDKKVAFIGKYAKLPRYQGGGSSHINSHKITSAMDAAAGNQNVVYAQGFIEEEDRVEEALMAEAVEAAKNADVAVIFAGLPDAFESEGFDRTHMRMPRCQEALIANVAKVQKNVVVVLHNGSPVEMPWLPEAKAVLEAYLGGQAVGGAVYDILYGKVNPSAKLPETFPLKLSDNPSYLNFPGEGDCVEYKEGIFVGYRYYDKKQMEVLFPFGHGLSYTTFSYSNLTLSTKQMKDTESLLVSVDIENTGNREGKEVVQLYVGDVESTVIRPVRELKGFAKIGLKPGEKKTVHFTLSKRAFAYYHTGIKDWHVETGEFEIQIGKSSRDIVLTERVVVESTVKLPIVYTLDTIMADVMADKKAWETVSEVLNLNSMFRKPGEEDGAAHEAMSHEMMEAMLKFMPIRGVLSFGGGTGKLTMETMQSLIDQLNQG